MADDKNKQEKQEELRVDVKDHSEVEYLHRQYPDFSREEIVEAIRAKGPWRRDIIAYLVSKKIG